MQQEPGSYSFNFTDVIRFVIKWRKHLAIITLSAAVLAFIITLPFIIKPKYKSKAVFYPGTVNSISFALFYTIKERAQDALAYGDEENVEQYLQLAKSNLLRTKIARDFNLLEHYNIQESDPKKFSKLNKKFEKNFTISRTSYNSVEVVVLDEDPNLAAALANAVMYNTDSLKRQSQRVVARQAFDIVEQQYFAKVAVLDSLSEATRRLGAKGVYNVEEQSRGLAELIGKGASSIFTDKERQNLGQHVGDFVSLDEQIRFEAEQLTELRKKYQQARVDLEGKMSNIFVVETAMPDEDKAYPVRSLVILITALAAFLMGVVGIVILERFKNIRQEL